MDIWGKNSFLETRNFTINTMSGLISAFCVSKMSPSFHIIDKLYVICVHSNH